MTWMKAVAAMREGKRVKRKGWQNNWWYELSKEDHEFIVDQDGNHVEMMLSDFLVDDWQRRYAD